MAHYFDDIFTRHTNRPHTPKTPRPHHMRRSSTSRSIAERSDFDDEGDNVRTARNSISAETPERTREREEADRHLANHVSEQLSRVKSHASEVFESGDEFEAQLDE